MFADSRGLGSYTVWPRPVSYLVSELFCAKTAVPIMILGEVERLLDNSRNKPSRHQQSAMKCNGMQAMPLYPYPCIYYSITDYVLSSMYSDLSSVPVISEVQSYITS